MGLIYLWLLQWVYRTFWDGDRNSYDNDYLLERGHEQRWLKNMAIAETNYGHPPTIHY
jgi:hypothetical protein